MSSSRGQRHGQWLKTSFMAMVAVSLAPFPAISSEPPVKRHVVIVANNSSHDEGVPPLRFADDDGARYYELFRASGAEVTLLSVLDPDAQAKFPKAAAAAILPTRSLLSATLGAVFAQMKAEKAQGITTELIFVYAGHGSLGPNREGFLTLLDGKLTRRMLYRDIIAPSPASFNHLILDACHSYFVVNKRGDASHRRGKFDKEIRGFLEAEELSSYPNTGVLLATSKSSETHEWHQLESGIFSHQLLSALSGAADVDEDGVITYSEAAAFVEAANAGITVPKAKLSVYFRPPLHRTAAPLMNMADFRHSPSVVLEETMAGRYSIEDSRGVRVLDINFSNEQAVTIRLMGQPPFFVRTGSEEAVVTDAGTTTLSPSDFTEIGERKRGSVEQSFRKDLFSIPFGKGFYHGILARTDASGTGLQIVISEGHRADQGHPLALSGWLALGVGVAGGVASGVLYGFAKASYRDYSAADDKESAVRLRTETEDLRRASHITLGVSIGLGVLGGSLLAAHLIEKSRRTSSRRSDGRFSPVLVLSDDFGYLGIGGSF